MVKQICLVGCAIALSLLSLTVHSYSVGSSHRHTARHLRKRNPQAGTTQHCLPKSENDGSSSPDSDGSLSPSYTGNGTTWGASWTGGNCAFTRWPQPTGYGSVAMNSNQWNASNSCGACLNITGPGGTFTGIVMDQCPSCKENSLDLDSEMWGKLSGGQPPGIIPVTWNIMPCGFPKPLVFINKEGSSKDWNSIQIAGSNSPVAQLEVSTNGGTSWIPLVRKTDSNYFQTTDNKGLGSIGDVRVTCSTGKQFTTKGVDIATADKRLYGSSNC